MTVRSFGWHQPKGGEFGRSRLYNSMDKTDVSLLLSALGLIAALGLGLVACALLPAPWPA
jgi:hypothetical protein